MRLALVNIRQLFDFTEQMVQMMLDQVMGQALKYFDFSNGHEEFLGGGVNLLLRKLRS